MTNFQPLAGAAALEVGLTADDLCRGERFFAQFGRQVDAGQGLLVGRVCIADKRCAGSHAWADLNPGVYPGNGMLGAARVNRVSHADKDRIEIGVHTGHRAFEQELAAVGLQFIVGELRQRRFLDDE